MLKLNKLAAADTATLKLLDAAAQPLLTEDGQRVSLVIYGPGSKPFVAAKTDQQNRMITRVQAKRSMSESPESKQRSEAEFLAAITAGDTGLDIEGLTDGLTGFDKYLAIYSHTPIGFIAEQVTKFAGDWANFTPGSATS